MESKLVLTCSDTACGHRYSVLPRERSFYETKHLPLPSFCPTCRHRQRMALRSERQLYRRPCASCEQNTLTTYPAEAPYIVYCQECFWKHIA
jgi:hypothetical protein